MNATATPKGATVDSLNINWSAFSESERRTIRRGIETGAYEHLAAMIDSVTPEKADEIAKIQAQLRPRAFVFESRVQKEFAQWMSKNGPSITPEIEREWQAKIDKEREDALKNLTGGGSAQVEITDTGVNINTSNSLDSIPGVAEASVKKLNEAGIYSVNELSVKSHDEVRSILNPLTAASIKKFFDNQKQA